jgi:transcriptional regulator with PAS, ATPase and Fis domain
MESELFGHKAGAFTGANTKEPKVGLLELVDGGTLFLDELSHLNPDLQAKLLRVLETGDFLPVGDVQHKHFKGRIIAAINTDPETAIRNAKLNKDLYYRLAGIPIRIPALRDRKTDIPLLVNYFLKLYSKGTEKILEPEAMDKLISLPWSGNVRELSYFVGRLPLFAEGSNFITKADVEEEIFQGGILATEDSAALTLEITQGGSSESHIARLKNALVQVRREIIVQSLTQAQGNVERAAQIYGVSRRSFTDYLKKFEIKPKDFKSLPSNRVAIPLD